MKCSRCGMEIGNSNFCPRCGLNIAMLQRPRYIPVPMAHNMAQEIQTTNTQIGKHIGLKVTFFVLLGAIIIFVLSIKILFYLQPKSYNSNYNTKTMQEQIYAASTISESEFNKIMIGDTYKYICEIIGSDGEIIKESVTSATYSWPCDTGNGNAYFTFKDGKLFDKTQYGF